MSKKDRTGYILPDFDKEESIEDKIKLINFCIFLINQEREGIKQRLNSLLPSLSRRAREKSLLKLARYDRYYSELESWRSTLLQQLKDE